VDIELFGQLAPDVPRRQALVLERPMTVRDVAILLGVEPDRIGLVVVNGVQSEMEDPAPSVGRLCFFPLLSGG